MNSNGGIETPHPHDILFGRGAGIYKHHGNVILRQLVDQNKELYASCAQHYKTDFAWLMVVSLQLRQDPPARFLEKNKEDGLWYEVDTKTAKKKMQQSLRDITRKSSARRKQASEQQGNAATRLIPKVRKSLSAPMQVEASWINKEVLKSSTVTDTSSSMVSLQTSKGQHALLTAKVQVQAQSPTIVASQSFEKAAENQSEEIMFPKETEQETVIAASASYKDTAEDLKREEMFTGETDKKCSTALDMSWKVSALDLEGTSSENMDLVDPISRVSTTAFVMPTKSKSNNPSRAPGFSRGEESDTGVPNLQASFSDTVNMVSLISRISTMGFTTTQIGEFTSGNDPVIEPLSHTARALKANWQKADDALAPLSPFNDDAKPLCIWQNEEMQNKPSLLDDFHDGPLASRIRGKSI